MAKGYSARGGFSGGGSAMRQQQMQQKLLYVDLQRWRQQ